MITDKTGVKFSNERIRPAADRLAQAYYHARQVVDEWQAMGHEKTFPDDATGVDDGASVDGRKPITGSNVCEIIKQLQGVLDTFEANDKAVLKAVLCVAVNPER